MTAGAAARYRTAGGQAAWALAAALCAIAVLCALWQMAWTLPIRRWSGAAWAPSTDVADLVFHFSTLPRIAVAALAGAALAAGGTIFQHVLSNPLASPVTLGVSSGAQLAMILVTVAAPETLGRWPGGAALAGGLGAVGLAMLVAAPWRFTPAAVILAGLAIGLFCGALGHGLKIFNQEYLASVFLWNGGAIEQNDWSVATTLLPRLAGLGVLVLLILRPLNLLGFGEESARGLGLPAGPMRLIALALGVGFASVITASVGMIGFVDIAAPLAARLAGARRLGTRLIVAPLIGAALLVIVDTIVQGLNTRFGTTIPTGATTALLAAPLLLTLAPRLRPDPRAGAPDWSLGTRRGPVMTILVVLGLLTVLAFVAACVIGPAGIGTAATLLPWRFPRALEALAAGAMLATAGALLQRATGNLLASPEVLGLGAAVMVGFAFVLFFVQDPSGPVLVAAGTAGALAMALALLGGNWRTRFAPEQFLLSGVALAAALDAGLVVCLATNDPRATLLLNWLAGTTASAQTGQALALAALAIVLVPICFLFRRSLGLLPLGDAAARGLGLSLTWARGGLMMLVALLTASAVLAVGPLTFVGLVGPHLSRRLGLHGPVAELGGAALIGGFTMVMADWIGRVVFAPFELPSGLVAALIGCPYLLLQLRKRG